MKVYDLTVAEFGIDRLEQHIQSVLGWAIWLNTHSRAMRGEDAALVARAAEMIISNTNALRVRLDRSEWNEREV